MPNSGHHDSCHVKALLQEDVAQPFEARIVLALLHGIVHLSLGVFDNVHISVYEYLSIKTTLC